MTLDQYIDSINRRFKLLLIRWKNLVNLLYENGQRNRT